MFRRVVYDCICGSGLSVDFQSLSGMGGVCRHMHVCLCVRVYVKKRGMSVFFVIIIDCAQKISLFPSGVSTRPRYRDGSENANC